MSNLPSSQQRDVIKDVSPPWLCTGWNERYMYNLGLACDVILEKLNQAIKARMPGLGTYTALPYIGLDRVMFQGQHEDNASFATRLTQAFDTWQRAGSRRAVMGQAMSYVAGFNPEEAGQVPRCVIVGDANSYNTVSWHTYYNTSDLSKAPAYCIKSPPNWDWDGDPLHWRAWLIMFFSPGATLGPEETWGEADGDWGDDNGSWGFNIPSSFFDGLRILVRLWKSASTYYPWFIFCFNGGDASPGSLFSPNSNSLTTGNPDGTWGKWGTVVDGVYVPSRSADARYVDGTGVYQENCSIPVEG